jgi:hypothetical protein
MVAMVRECRCCCCCCCWWEEEEEEDLGGEEAAGSLSFSFVFFVRGQV